MAALNPTTLSTSTRFRPTHVRAHSRSPSRSPVRRAQFTAQNLDPLLRNLSPDSTLKALQATEIIPIGPGQNVLTKSIEDATPAEREVGIRAAFAAQKLREWRNEISNWPWPDRTEISFGAGFLPPAEADTVVVDGQRSVYLGCLPLKLVDRYEQRIDEIRDSLESLEMDNIKDHVLQAHSPASQPTMLPETPEKRFDGRKSYGRMRDFTALITATVIQALPDLAIVTMLIETWDVRLTIMRDLPMMLGVMQAARAGVRMATATVREPSQAPLITATDFETTKRMLGEKVSNLGSRIDRMLDVLEGQEDALPQSWIDSLEKIELDYATWVVETQRLVTLNESLAKNKKVEQPPENNTSRMDTLDAIIPNGSQPMPQPPPLELTAAGSSDNGPSSLDENSMVPLATAAAAKPALKLATSSQQAHRRGVSEVSVADSAYSAFSDISQAEIVEAMPTPVMPNPKVGIVNSPSRFDAPKPPLLQRASTASIEIVNKDQLKKVDLRKSMSADLLAKMPQNPESTPAKALEQLSGRPIRGTTPIAELEDPTSTYMQDRAVSPRGLHSPSVPVSPLAVKAKHTANARADSDVPTLPRKSSKRRSLGPGMELSPSEGSSISDLVSPITPHAGDQATFQRAPTAAKSVKITAPEDSLEAKIKDILQKLPTKIRLADSSQSNESSSASSTRASTLTPALTLSPVKQPRKSSASDTDVRLFHLTQHGQTRDATPIKLFVRTVGENGERVMVRVGGGWADLGEYLREYSLHHGNRTVSDSNLEVAQYPGKEKQPAASAAVSRNARPSIGGSRSPSPPPPTADPNIWTPPPVPAIPAGYSVRSPVMQSTTMPNGITRTTIDDPEPTASPGYTHIDGDANHAPSIVKSNTTSVGGITTTTTVSVPQNPKSTSYTPLGAAGPVPAARRAATYGATPATSNDRWVNGVVDKARAVSTNVVQGPTTTTTTKVVSSAAPSRRASTLGIPPTAQKPLLSTAQLAAQRAPSELKLASPATPKDSNGPARRKSFLGFGDGGGSIRRVFLRKKSGQ